MPQRKVRLGKRFVTVMSADVDDDGGAKDDGQGSHSSGMPRGDVRTHYVALYAYAGTEARQLSFRAGARLVGWLAINQ